MFFLVCIQDRYDGFAPPFKQPYGTSGAGLYFIFMIGLGSCNSLGNSKDTKGDTIGFPTDGANNEDIYIFCPTVGEGCFNVLLCICCLFCVCICCLFCISAFFLFLVKSDK